MKRWNNIEISTAERNLVHATLLPDGKLTPHHHWTSWSPRSVVPNSGKKCGYILPKYSTFHCQPSSSCHFLSIDASDWAIYGMFVCSCLLRALSTLFHVVTTVNWQAGRYSRAVTRRELRAPSPPSRSLSCVAQRCNSESFRIQDSRFRCSCGRGRSRCH